MPWGAVYVETDGNVDHCCISYNSIGNIHEHSLSSAIAGKKNIAIKSEMLAGNKAQGCYKCYSPGGEADRDYLRDVQLRHFEQWLPDFSLYDKPENFELQYADLRMRNTCNYACVYCSPTLSSTWAAELKEFVKTNEDAIDNVSGFFYDNMSTLKQMYLAGGEPMLIKENEVLLERLLEVNPTCSLLVNTNLSMIEGNRIFELLTKFENVQWLISVEDIKQRYNYIRYPGDWNVFAANLALLKRTVPSTHIISFNMVFTALNAKTIFSCINFLLTSGYAKNSNSINIAYINGGHQPTWLDPRALPKPYLDQVRTLLHAYPKTGHERFDGDIQYLKECIDVPVEFEPYHNLFVRLAEMDQRRKLNSKDVFPDIYASRQ
jgi:MoaA/NifB/PqqE/SkfB family radical SAM enzyme